VLVSKNHSLIFGMVSNLFALKSTFPQRYPSWQFEISDGVGVLVEDIDSKKIEVVRELHNLSAENEIFSLFYKGEFVLEISEETDTKIGVVLENSSVFTNIPVTAVSKIEDNGTVVFAQGLFDRAKTFHVSLICFIFLTTVFRINYL
jgi:hypothetical protein